VTSVTLRCERSEPIKSAVADLTINDAKSGKPDFIGATASKSAIADLALTFKIGIPILNAQRPASFEGRCAATSG
jgi:hypothetical protein